MPKGVKNKPEDGATVVSLPKINIQVMELTLIGDSPLISHAWSERNKKLMLDKMMGQPNVGLEPKDPQREYEESLYKFRDGKHGFPSVAFKSAAVSACRFVDGIKMTEARGAFHIVGDMVEIQGEPEMREDIVKIGMGVSTIRYRGEFRKWKATLRIRYNAYALTKEQITNLLNVAGFGIGVGDWRPERNGSFGMFHVGTSEEL
jgi:hypothetical protein